MLNLSKDTGWFSSDVCWWWFCDLNIMFSHCGGNWRCWELNLIPPYANHWDTSWAHLLLPAHISSVYTTSGRKGTRGVPDLVTVDIRCKQSNKQTSHTFVCNWTLSGTLWKMFCLYPLHDVHAHQSSKEAWGWPHWSFHYTNWGNWPRMYEFWVKKGRIPKVETKWKERNKGHWHFRGTSSTM